MTATASTSAPDPRTTQLQVMTSTSYLRYNEIYAALRDDLGVPARPRVLVFGCSSGLELRTIRHFWPEATVAGCDILPDILDQARAAAPFADVFLSTPEAIRERGPFDLVCANSVLCRHPFPKDDFAAAMPFATFAGFFELLVDVTAPGGHLMAMNVNYSPFDLDLIADLTPIAVADSWNNGFVPRVDREGRPTARPVMIEGQLDRWHVGKGFDPIGPLTCAVFRREPGTIRHPTGALGPLDLAGGAVMSLDPPILERPDVVRPWRIDLPAADGGALRATLISNPARGGWSLHGIARVPQSPSPSPPPSPSPSPR